MDRTLAAISCFIDDCPWWVNPPAGPALSGPQRDEITIQHVFDNHSVQEVLQQIQRLRTEVVHGRLTREQAEDRNCIIHELRKVIAGDL